MRRMDRIYYVAEDGKEFSDCDECRRHERTCQLTALLDKIPNMSGFEKEVIINFVFNHDADIAQIFGWEE